MFHRKRATILIILLMAVITVVSVHAARSKMAMVTGVYGKVTVYQENMTKNARMEMLLYKDDRVVTGGNGKAVLLLKDGSEVKLAPKTELVIEDTGKKRGLLIRIGTIFAKMTKGKADFEIRSPYGAAAIEGTELQIDVSGKHSKLTVAEGKVRYYNSKHKVLVAQNMQSLSDSMGNPISAPKKVNVDRIVRWQIAIERYDYAIETIRTLFDKMVAIKQASPGGWSLAGAQEEMAEFNRTIDLLNSMAADSHFERGHKALKLAAYSARQYLALNNPAQSNQFLVQYQEQMQIVSEEYPRFKEYFEEELRKFLL